MLKKIVIEYRSGVVISTEPVYGFKSQFVVSVIENITAVIVTFKIKHKLALNIKRSKYYNGGALNLQLEKIETYQIDHVSGLTETLI